jgi:multidrug efflux pump
MNGPGHAEDHDVRHPFYVRFRQLVSWCVRRRWLVIGITLVLFVLSIVGMGKVQSSSSRIRPALS